jgi:radical SAM enzyme (TIGR01210 family)
MTNKPLNETVRSIKQKRLKKAKPCQNASFWREKDVLDGAEVDAGVIVLPTRGCGWGRSSGCTMCGYVYDAGALTDPELEATLGKAIDKLGEIPYLKIFTSGSFFDKKEVSKKVLDSLIERIYQTELKQFQVESRPEFLSKDGLKYFKENLDCRLEIGIGLETSNDLLRENCINKGFEFQDYERSVKLCNSLNVDVKTYLLLKPPFILEREGISDTVKSTIDSAEAGSAKISINPMNIQSGTLVEMLWKRREYKLPWLWSLVEVFKRIEKSKIEIPVISHPIAGGRKRGIHNCGKCDNSVLKAIREFSISQDTRIFDSINCNCKGHWKDYLLLE